MTLAGDCGLYDVAERSRHQMGGAMTGNSFTRGVVLATLAMLGTVGAAAAQPGFPATSFLTPVNNGGRNGGRWQLRQVEP